MNAPDHAISDRYALLQRLGVGGMATVWRASDRLLGRMVAVKILSGETASDPVFVERFRREAQAVAQLNHPNIVSVYDWGQTDDSYFMVMEYVDGQNLKQKLRGGPLDEVEALDIAAQVAAALEAAHEQGVIHRDIKPQNVLLGPDGQVKVVDFGIAFTPGRTQLTRAHAVAGTAHYLSPEQAQTKSADARSDLYSLGVVLYEMLVGHEPFEGVTLIEIAMKHVNEVPAPPRQQRPSLSILTNGIVMRAMTKNPNQRYQSASEMRDALIEARDSVRNPNPVLIERTVAAPLDPPASAMAVRSTLSERRWLIGIPVALALIAIIPTGLLHGTAHHSGAPLPRSTATSITRRHMALVQHPRGRTATPRSTAHTTVAAAIAPRHRVTPTTTSSRPSVTSTTAPVLLQAPIPAAATPSPSAISTVVSSAPVSLASSGDSTPDQTVADFYNSVANANYSHAASLWTSAMQARCAPAACIQGNFSQMLFVRASNLAVVSNDGKNAQVQVVVQEKYPGPGAPKTLSGTWWLVRGPNGWLMDAEKFA